VTVAETMYPRVAAFFYGTPWAILPEKLAVMESLLRAHMAGWRPSEAEIAAAIGARRDRNGGPARPAGAVAVLPIHGVISQRADLMTESSGGTSTEALTRGLRLAMADPEVGGIVLDVDSPGGSVFGIEELASEIAAANQAEADRGGGQQPGGERGLLAGVSAAGELSVTPSGEVGSIGVIAAHQDESGLQARLGVTTTLITAGKYKGEANPYQPLGDEARTALQARVDDYYGAFTRAVAKGRRVTVDAVRGGFGEGRMLGAQDAVRGGMADRVETLDQAIARMQAMLAGGGRAGGNGAASVWLPPIAAAAAEPETQPEAEPEVESEPELPPLPDVAAPQGQPASASDDADLRRRRLRLREHAR
jgi:signal peptide peptidase SppA